MNTDNMSVLVLTMDYGSYGSWMTATGASSSVAEHARNDRLHDHFLNRDRFTEWAVRYRDRLRSEGSHDDERCKRTNRGNLKHLLRNYLAQTAIENAKNKDFLEVNRPFPSTPDSPHHAARHGVLRVAAAELGQASGLQLLILRIPQKLTSVVLASTKAAT
jgi:uncharacterized protein YdiU (UPF0061 family)